MNISLDLRVFEAKRYFCRGEPRASGRDYDMGASRNATTHSFSASLSLTARSEAKTTTTIRHAYYSSSYSEFLMVTSPTHFPERVLLIYGRSLPESVCMV
nr:hypothetical protein Q903MT_gene6120 [Picea sitchensis]